MYLISSLKNYMSVLSAGYTFTGSGSRGVQDITATETSFTFYRTWLKLVFVAACTVSLVRLKNKVLRDQDVPPHQFHSRCGAAASRSFEHHVLSPKHNCRWIRDETTRLLYHCACYGDAALDNWRCVQSPLCNYVRVPGKTLWLHHSYPCYGDR